MGCKPITPRPIYVRLSPDGEALVWGNVEDKEKIDLELGAQSTFEASANFQHVMLRDIQLVINGQMAKTSKQQASQAATTSAFPSSRRICPWSFNLEKKR